MDAAHMMLTVNRLHAEGLRHFAMVHDSYGVHACDIDLLHRILREEFVRIYSEPVLLKFLAEQRQANPGIDLPEPPPAGNLDIRRVLESPYFFA
jgi:DNA-directed RNA polymerase